APCPRAAAGRGAGNARFLDSRSGGRDRRPVLPAPGDEARRNAARGGVLPRRRLDLWRSRYTRQRVPRDCRSRHLRCRRSRLPHGTGAQVSGRGRGCRDGVAVGGRERKLARGRPGTAGGRRGKRRRQSRCGGGARPARFGAAPCDAGARLSRDRPGRRHGFAQTLRAGLFADARIAALVSTQLFARRARPLRLARFSLAREGPLAAAARLCHHRRVRPAARRGQGLRRAPRAGRRRCDLRVLRGPDTRIPSHGRADRRGTPCPLPHRPDAAHALRDVSDRSALIGVKSRNPPMLAQVEKISVDRKVVRAACPHDCPDTCAMKITVENGIAVKVEGAKDHPFTAGTLCTKVARYLERTYSKDRVLFPQKRIGAKGRGEFERISWDEAIDIIAEKLRAAEAEDPQGILPYDYAGTMGYVQWHSMGRRFFNRLGASRLDRTICSSAGKAGMLITLGGSLGMDPERFDEAKLILIWGSNPIVSNLHLWSRVQEAKRRGAKLVAIDPYRSLSAEKCHEHLAPLPGTDAALALGMMHVIIGEGRHDADYVERYTLGFEALARRVKEYPPRKPAAIRLNYGLQRHAGGGMAVRNILCLPALTGAWRDPAGGAVLSTGGFFGMNDAKLERPDLLGLSRCPNPRTINMVAIGDALLE